MMEKYSLVYIDDTPDVELTKYLDRFFHSENYEIEFKEIRFYPESGYESLLSNPDVKSANIILIDSLLFENRNATGGKFTGEEFKLVLRKFFPFIEVIVVTQNGTDKDIEKIAKYDKSCGKTARDYYSNLLPPRINSAISNIRQYQLLADMLNNNDSWDEVLKDKVINTLKGKNTYDKLTKEDIDALISAFKQIEENLND